ncbi:hypothetical protein Taro_046784, partial [Colocasia esculenta]|nr:hypothetical protein [Colocasia esculenta]
LPPQSSLRLHVHYVSRVGWPADVDHGKATAFSVAFRELGPESLKVPGMGLQLCGLQVWCWLVEVLPVVVCLCGSTILVVDPWWYLMLVGTYTLCGWFCVVVLCVPVPSVGPFVRDCETERLVEVLPVVVCLCGSTILVVDPWWYLMLVGIEVDWCSVEVCVGVRWIGKLMPILLPYVGRLPVKLVASAINCCNDLHVRLVA